MVTNTDELSLAERVVRDACPLRRSFVERPEGATEPTPLSRLLRTQGDAGGKGGGLRVSLLLSLIWLCAKEPYTTARVAAYWAELIGRSDPRDEGARAIRDCLHELQERGVISLVARGPRVEIGLNSETSSVGHPRPYLPPYDIEPYLPVPRTFWTRGLAGDLSGAGVAMYLVSHAMTRHDEPDFFLSGEFFEERFGISRSSKKRGLAELVKHGVLEVRSDSSIDIQTWRNIRRNIYSLHAAFMQPAPKDDPTKQPDSAGTEKVAPETPRRKRSAREQARGETIIDPQEVALELKHEGVPLIRSGPHVTRRRHGSDGH